jgi:hypothetical protein
MTSPKTFTIKKSEKPPIPFNLDIEQEDGTTKTVTFRLKPKVPGSLILDLVASGSLGAEWQAAALRKFFSEALTADDREDFFATIDDADHPIDLKDLTSMSQWFVEQYGENPTPPAAQS